MLQILAHADLFHQLVLVTVHSGELADVSEDVLKPVGQLESVDVVQSILYVRVDDEFRQTQDLTAQMERVTETRLFTLLGRQRPHRFQVKIVVQMEVVDILAVNQQVQHVPSLPTNLKTNLDPIQRSLLKELGGFERAEEVALPLGLGRPVLQGVQHVVLEQLLVRHANFDGLSGRAMLAVPHIHQRHIEGSTRESRAQIKRTRSPQKRNAVGRIVRVQREFL